jgi:hypothetical protein
MKNKLLIGFAVAGALVFSGMLGKGDLLGIKTVFGYGYSGMARSGSTVTATPALTVQVPLSGGSYVYGTILGISWTAVDGAFTKYKVSYSTDNGTGWSSISDNATGTSMSWTVPNASTTAGKVRVEGYDASGSLLATGLSGGSFTIVGTIPAPVVPPETPAPAPAVDSTVTGSYAAATAKANNPTIADDKRLTPVTGALCTAGSLIKGSLPAVYYCGADGKRYVFVNDKAFLSWFADFSGVQIVSDETLASITIGGNITYRPGSRMVKIVSDLKVYAVARGGVLRWVSSEAIAAGLYGSTWNMMIDDVPDSFFVNYTIGTPISS